MVVKGITVSSFFDESGKFSDKKVVCFGGVTSYNEDFIHFADEWGRQLARNGLEILSVKEAFRSHRPLSKKNERIGVENRIQDLLPFIACIRKYLLVVTGITIDTQAFKNLPQHFFETYGNDPHFVAFARSLLKVIEFTHSKDKVIFVCDDQERIGELMFKLWRRIKKVFPGARNKLMGISFADDKFLFALQAADLVSGLMRLEAARKFFGTPYDYLPLFQALAKDPLPNGERIWDLQIVFADEPMLRGLSKSLEEERKKQLDEENKRIRKLRPRSA